MELLGFKRSMAKLEDAGLTVGAVITDRHVQIRKEMSKEHNDKNHQFDVWHLSKSIKKKIATSSQRSCRPKSDHGNPPSPIIFGGVPEMPTVIQTCLKSHGPVFCTILPTDIPSLANILQDVHMQTSLLKK